MQGTISQFEEWKLTSQVNGRKLPNLNLSENLRKRREVYDTQLHDSSGLWIV